MLMNAAHRAVECRLQAFVYLGGISKSRKFGLDCAADPSQPLPHMPWPTAPSFAGNPCRLIYMLQGITPLNLLKTNLQVENAPSGYLSRVAYASTRHLPIFGTVFRLGCVMVVRPMIYGLDEGGKP